MKKTAKPALEKVNPEFGSSFAIKQYFEKEDFQANHEPFWHFHPELELVYINGGNGKRHIGNHLSYFYGGDLILIGSNLPHSGFTNRLTRNRSETVIQMRRDFLGETFFNAAEMKEIQHLIQKAASGLSFYGATKKRIGKKMEDLPGQPPFQRLMGLLYILQELAKSTEYQLLNAEGLVFEVEQQDNNRADQIYGFVHQHFEKPIPLEKIAAQVSMTVPSFCRFFKKLSAGKTFTQFVNEYRIMHACKLLAEETNSITEISYSCGFNNFSHFSRSFRKITGKTPSDFRKEFKRMLD